MSHTWENTGREAAWQCDGPDRWNGVGEMAKDDRVAKMDQKVKVGKMEIRSARGTKWIGLVKWSR